LFPTPPSDTEAEEAAQLLMELVQISPGSRVVMVGPVTPGTQIQERRPQNEPDATEITLLPADGEDEEWVPVELAVPEEDGNYYAFFIDDQPWSRYGHNVRYAWIEAETHDFAVTDALFPPFFLEPGVLPEAFEAIKTFELGGVTFCFGHRGGAGKNNDISHKSEATKPAAAQPSDCKKVALVLDCGDLDDNKVLGDLADDFADDAKAMKEYLEANGYTVQRISQYWGNGVPALKNSLTLRADLKKIVEAYADHLKCPEGEDCCHEFFLYISAHGDKSSFHLYDPRGNSLFDRVKYSSLDLWLSKLPSCVKIIIFVDACYSGNAINSLKKVLERCNTEVRCGVTIMTSADTQKESPGGDAFSTSATEHFMDGDDEDHDGDGKEGDLNDRYKEMKEELEDDTNPQLKMCPGQTDLCSLD
jgi:hypothetical protein